MQISRRDFPGIAGAGLACEAVASVTAWSGIPQNFKAVAFDASPVFDPRPIFALAKELFPGQGAELSGAWRTGQLEYQWLQTLAGRYADFWQATEESLVCPAKLLKGCRREHRASHPMAPDAR